MHGSVNKKRGQSPSSNISRTPKLHHPEPVEGSVPRWPSSAGRRCSLFSRMVRMLESDWKGASRSGQAGSIFLAASACSAARFEMAFGFGRQCQKRVSNKPCRWCYWFWQERLAERLCLLQLGLSRLKQHHVLPRVLMESETAKHPLRKLICNFRMLRRTGVQLPG